MAENRALGGGRHKLVLVLLAGVFAQVAEAPRVKLVKRGLWGHGREVFGIDGAGLAGRGDGDDGVVGEVVAAGEGDALGGGDEAGEHCCFAKKKKGKISLVPLHSRMRIFSLDDDDVVEDDLPDPRGCILWLSLMKLSSFRNLGIVFLRSLPPGSSAETRWISSRKTGTYSGCAARSYRTFVKVMLVV